MAPFGTRRPSGKRYDPWPWQESLHKHERGRCSFNKFIEKVFTFKSTFRTTLTDEVASLPLVLFCADGDLKPDISLSKHERLNTDDTVPIHVAAHNFLGVKTTGHAVIGLKARSSDIHDCAAEHVTRLGRKDQR